MLSFWTTGIVNGCQNSIDPREIAAVLHQYAGVYRPLAGLQRMIAVHSGFSGATVVRVESAAGCFCLRGWPPESLPRERIAGLHRLLEHTRNGGITQVAVPVASRSGETIVTVAGRLWQLEPWMPGTADFWQFPTEARLACAMRCLAAWHRCAETFRPQENEREWFFVSSRGRPPAAAERLQKMVRLDSPRLAALQAELDAAARSEFSELGREVLALYRRAAPRVRDELNLAANVPVPLQPCLRDIWHDHLLFTDDQLTGLIDASACRTENVASDLSRLLGSLLGDDFARWGQALEIYRKLRPLSSDETALIAALDRSQTLLAGMTWIERRFLAGSRDVDTPPVLERMRRIVSRLRNIASPSGSTWTP